MHFGLNPWLVLSHFLLSVVVLTLGVVLALEVRGRERTRLAADFEERCVDRSRVARLLCTAHQSAAGTLLKVPGWTSRSKK